MNFINSRFELVNGIEDILYVLTAHSVCMLFVLFVGRCFWLNIHLCLLLSQFYVYLLICSKVVIFHTETATFSGYVSRH